MKNSASDFGKDLGLMHEVVVTGRKVGFTSEDWGVLAHNENKIREVLGLIRGDVAIQFDSIVHIDCLVRPAYPDWVKEVLRPELEGTGPAKYDVAKLEQWLHDGQKNGGWIKGQVIYEYLKEKKMLEPCLGLSDLLAIKAKGIYFFRQHFAGKAVLGWKSTVQHHHNNLLRVPYLCDDGEEVILRWAWLKNYLNDEFLTLRFTS